MEKLFFKNPFRKRPDKIALVLGGGSARGLAHIGILKVLERESIPIDIIVGTSIGSLVGGAYAVGVPIAHIEEYARGYSWKDIYAPTLPRLSLSEGTNLAKIVNRILEGKNYEDAKIPFVVVTTNIETGKEIVFTKGDLPLLLQASCSWPGIFPPVNVDGMMLVDGGVKNSVPTLIARSLGADFIITCDVGFHVRQGKLNNIFEYFVQGIQIMGEELNRYQSLDADVVIKVELDNIDQVAFDKAHISIPKGEEAALNMIKTIKKRLGI